MSKPEPVAVVAVRDDGRRVLYGHFDDRIAADANPAARAFSPHRQAVSILGPVLEVAEWRWRVPLRVPIAGAAT